MMFQIAGGIIIAVGLLGLLAMVGGLWRAFMLSEGAHLPRKPLTPEDHRNFWMMIAILLIAFGGGIFVHPLFILMLYGWAAWSNYRKHGNIFRRA